MVLDGRRTFDSFDERENEEIRVKILQGDRDANRDLGSGFVDQRPHRGFLASADQRDRG
jgi:hypothetical protein